jgi:hypothetical protein
MSNSSFFSGCPGRVHTTLGHVVHFTDHNHVSDEEGVTSASLKSKMQTKAANELTKSLKQVYSEIITETAQDASIESVVLAFSSCHSIMQRARANVLPLLPRTADEAIFEGTLSFRFLGWLL